MFVADLHNDLVQRIMEGEDVTKITSHGHTDIPRLKESCINLQILIIWVSSKAKNPNFFNKANRMFDELEKLSNIENVKIPRSIQDITEGINNNELLLSISMEGGEALENNLENLYHFINRGLLYFGPTWNHSLDWVSSNYDEKYNKTNIKTIGLNDFGKEVVNICQENKILIDVSHIGEKSFWDIENISQKPFIASHSSVYKICPHFRNLHDDQIIAIKNKKGLIGINPYPFFIDPTFKKRESKTRNEYKEKIKSIEIQHSNRSSQWLAKQHFFQKKLSSICPELDLFIDHMEYIIKLIGIDYVGVGSDYDGLDCLPKGWNDCLDHIKIAEKLESRGYNQEEIEKLMGNNFLRVLEEINY